MGKNRRSKSTLEPEQDILSGVKELNLTEMHSVADQPRAPLEASDSKAKIKLLKPKYKPNSKKTPGDPATAIIDSLSIVEMDLDAQLKKALSRKPKIRARTSQSDTEQLWSLQSKMRDFVGVPGGQSIVSAKGFGKRGPSPQGDDLFFNHTLRRSISKVSSGNLAAMKAVVTKAKRKKRSNTADVTPRRRLKIAEAKPVKRVKFSNDVIVFTVPANEERGSCDWRKNLTKEGLLEAMLWKTELLKAGVTD